MHALCKRRAVTHAAAAAATGSARLVSQPDVTKLASGVCVIRAVRFTVISLVAIVSQMLRSQVIKDSRIVSAFSAS